MEPIVIGTLVFVAAILGLLLAALIASFRRSPKDWHELRELDRDLKLENPDGAVHEKEGFFYTKEDAIVSDQIFTVTLDNEENAEKLDKEIRRSSGTLRDTRGESDSEVN